MEADDRPGIWPLRMTDLAAHFSPITLDRFTAHRKTNPAGQQAPKTLICHVLSHRNDRVIFEKQNYSMFHTFFYRSGMKRLVLTVTAVPLRFSNWERGWRWKAGEDDTSSKWMPEMMWRSVSADWFLSLQEPLLGLSKKGLHFDALFLCFTSFCTQKSVTVFQETRPQSSFYPCSSFAPFEVPVTALWKHGKAYKCCALQTAPLDGMQGGVPGVLWFLQTDIIAPQWCSVAYVVWYMRAVKSSKSRAITALSKTGALSAFLL